MNINKTLSRILICVFASFISFSGFAQQLLISSDGIGPVCPGTVRQYTVRTQQDTTVLTWTVTQGLFSNNSTTTTTRRYSAGDHTVSVTWSQVQASAQNAMPRGVLTVSGGGGGHNRGSDTTVILSVANWQTNIRVDNQPQNPRVLEIPYNSAQSFTISASRYFPNTTLTQITRNEWTVTGEGFLVGDATTSSLPFTGGESITIRPNSACSAISGFIRVRATARECITNQNDQNFFGEYRNLYIQRVAPTPSLTATDTVVSWGARTLITFTANAPDPSAVTSFVWEIFGDFEDTKTVTTTTNTIERIHRGLYSGMVRVQAIYCEDRPSDWDTIQVTIATPAILGPSGICAAETFNIANTSFPVSSWKVVGDFLIVESDATSAIVAPRALGGEPRHGTLTAVVNGRYITENIQSCRISLPLSIPNALSLLRYEPVMVSVGNVPPGNYQIFIENLASHCHSVIEQFLWLSPLSSNPLSNSNPFRFIPAHSGVNTIRAIFVSEQGVRYYSDPKTITVHNNHAWIEGPALLAPGETGTFRVRTNQSNPIDSDLAFAGIQAIWEIGANLRIVNQTATSITLESTRSDSECANTHSRIRVSYLAPLGSGGAVISHNATLSPAIPNIEILTEQPRGNNTTRYMFRVFPGDSREYTWVSISSGNPRPVPFGVDPFVSFVSTDLSDFQSHTIRATRRTAGCPPIQIEYFIPVRTVDPCLNLPRLEISFLGMFNDPLGRSGYLYLFETNYVAGWWEAFRLGSSQPIEPDWSFMSGNIMAFLLSGTNSYTIRATRSFHPACRESQAEYFVSAPLWRRMSEQIRFTVAPNPVSEYIKIEPTSEIKESIKELEHLLGSAIFSRSLFSEVEVNYELFELHSLRLVQSGSFRGGQNTVDVSRLRNGVYILRIMMGEHHETHTIFVDR